MDLLIFVGPFELGFFCERCPLLHKHMLRSREGYLERLGCFYPHWMGVFKICVDKVLSSLV